MPGLIPHNFPCEKPKKITLRTQTIPAQLGDDSTGSAYAPKPGYAFNTIVHYLANDAVYIYDSNGVFTKVKDPGFAELVKKVEAFELSLDELYNPAKIGYMVKTAAELEGLSPTVVPSNEFVLVTEDETHDGRPSLYYYNPSAGQFVYAYPASPYYEKPFVDAAIAALQTNINNVMNKEVADVANLQTNINAEVNARQAADAEVNQRITDIQNSPDVRFIEGTYAELEALDKSDIGDKDYARVLQDENHDGASTYYQFDLATQTWNYVGEVGSYYTKQQIDEMIGDVESLLTKLDTGEGV